MFLIQIKKFFKNNVPVKVICAPVFCTWCLAWEQIKPRWKEMIQNLPYKSEFLGTFCCKKEKQEMFFMLKRS